MHILFFHLKADFPTTAGAYQTAFGGFSSSGAGIAVDGNRDVYITGTTQSSQFPTTPNAFQPTAVSVQEAFVAKIIYDPEVTGVSPRARPEAGGDAVIITGENFTGPLAVTFGGTPAMFTVNSDTQITAITPSGKRHGACQSGNN